MHRSARRAHSLLARSGLPAALLALACAAAQADPGQGEPAQRAELDRRIAEIDSLLARAHFHTALGLARTTLEQVDTAWAGGAERRARLEVMAATAEVALGQTDRARASLVRALRAQPDLAFDERETSPKLLELARQARRHAGLAEPRP